MKKILLCLLLLNCSFHILSMQKNITLPFNLDDGIVLFNNILYTRIYDYGIKHKKGNAYKHFLNTTQLYDRFRNKILHPFAIALKVELFIDRYAQKTNYCPNALLILQDQRIITQLILEDYPEVTKCFDSDKDFIKLFTRPRTVI